MHANLFIPSLLFCSCVQLSALEQSSVLLKQDKEYLSKQVSELMQRCQAAEERCGYLLLQLTEAKQSKEQLYEQFVRSRSEGSVIHTTLSYLFAIKSV